MGLPVDTTIQNKSKTFVVHLLCPKLTVFNLVFKVVLGEAASKSPDKKKSASLIKKCEGQLIKVSYFIEFVSKREIQVV